MRRGDRAGAASDAAWLGRQTGESAGAARRSLDAARHLDEAPATDAAFRRGEISAEQAAAIAPAAARHPEEERRLLDLAHRQPLNRLREESNRVRARGEDAEARHERIHRSRHWRRWTDGAAHGAVRTG